MTTRVLPQSDTFASCPLEGRVLDHYAGTFEAVFVSLNPFIRPLNVQRVKVSSGERLSRASVVAGCEAVSWREVLRRTGLPSVGAIDIGLRTEICGLRKEFENKDYLAKLEKLTDTQGILTPYEGTFPELLHDKVLSAIQQLGYEWVWVADEFDTERKLRWIADLKDQEEGLSKGRFNIFTPDKQLLWTIHWDSHFSFLCSSRERLASFQAVANLEGFFCTPSTEVYWSIRSPDAMSVYP